MPAKEKPVRLTISVTPEVHAAFERLSAASGLSMSKCMGDWLGDTLDAIEYTATMVEKARSAPKMVMQELHAYALGMADETQALLKTMRQKVGAEGGNDGKRSAADRLGSVPPSCNTGGKLSKANTQPRGGNSK